MPIYEYQCQECGHHLDALQRISEPPLTDCPNCCKPALRKLVSAPSFRLKGGGWYETDFKTGSKRNLAGEKDAGSTEKKADKAESKAKGERPRGDGSGSKKTDSGSGAASAASKSD